MTRQKSIVLAAGGTGGHIYPAEALATELQGLNHQITLFTDSRGKSYDGMLGQLPTERISAATPTGKNPIGLLKAAGAIVVGFLQARKKLVERKAEVVVGFGGYPALPTVLAAQSLGLPTILHEQNAILGRANRLLAWKAQIIATTFPKTDLRQSGKKNRVIQVGNPVRKAIRCARETDYQPFTRTGEIRLLIMGGSQGARILSEILPRALAAQPDELRSRLTITQQCRPEDMSLAEAAYTAAGIQAHLVPFISDVPDQLSRCHLAITRAGASTISELACVGRPALLLPYPFATDDHQAANAQALVDAGGAFMIRDHLFEQMAATVIGDLLKQPHSLEKMAVAANEFGRPDAAYDLAVQVLEVAGSSHDRSNTHRGEAA